MCFEALIRHFHPLDMWLSSQEVGQCLYNSDETSVGCSTCNIIGMTETIYTMVALSSNVPAVSVLKATAILNFNWPQTHYL